MSVIRSYPLLSHLLGRPGTRPTGVVQLEKDRG